MKKDRLSPDECQPELDFSASVPPDGGARPLNVRECCRAALAFLASLSPDGAAGNVSTRRRTLKVAAAGFWRGKGRESIARTVIVAAGREAGECFSDGAFSPDRIARIRGLEKLRDEYEKEIRETEPHLAAADDLFDEFRSWDYAGSCHPEYHKTVRELETELRILRRGSRLELFRRAGVADFCYLALPEEAVCDDLPLPEWGIVAITRNGGFRLIRKAPLQAGITLAARCRLTENIAVAAAMSVWFSAGVEPAPGGNVIFRHPPRKRRKVSCR